MARAQTTVVDLEPVFPVIDKAPVGGIVLVHSQAVRIGRVQAGLGSLFGCC